MKTWTPILAAGAILALAAPAANAAVRAIPADADAVVRSGYHPLSTTRSAPVMHDARVTIKLGAHRASAYVPGGSSPKVSKAITDAAERMAR
jgi:hypothetical protein